MPKKQNSYDTSCESNSRKAALSPVKRSNARVGNFTLRKRTKSENGILSGELTDQSFEKRNLEECLIVAEREAEKHVRLRRERDKIENKEVKENNQFVTALYNYVPAQEDELELHPGDKVRVLSHDYRDSGTEGWWVGLRDSQIGVFPHNFVESDSSWLLVKEEDREQPEVAPRTPNESTHFHLITESMDTEEEVGVVESQFPQVPESSTGFAVSGSTGVRTIPPNEIEKLEILGFGAFGMVYHGRWNKQDVAMKTFSWHANELLIHQEAGHLSCLVHRHIVRLFGVSSLSSTNNPSSKQLALIMEYARGGALHQLLHSSTTFDTIHLSPRTLLGMSLQIASGMCYLHCQAHICHRDLKSSNVLIKEEIPSNSTDDDISRCTLLITDFGMARRTAELVSQQSKLGTLAYAAPEVCKQQGGFTVKSDVWSYGVLLWELLTKEIPFRDVEQPHLLYRIAFKNHKLYIPEGIPSILVSLLKNCWAEDKEKRPDFTKIIQILKKASNYKFIEIGANEFHQLQRAWREEIRRIESHTEDEEGCVDDCDDDEDSEEDSDVDYKWDRRKLEEAHNELLRREEAMQQREAACDRAMGTVMLFTVLAAANTSGSNSVNNNHHHHHHHHHQPLAPPRRRPFVGRLKFWSSNNAPLSPSNNGTNNSNYSNNTWANTTTGYGTEAQNSISPTDDCNSDNFQNSGNPNISAPSNLQHVVHISKDGLNFASPVLNFFPESMKMHTWEPRSGSSSGRACLAFRDGLRSTDEEHQEDFSCHTDTAESLDTPSPCLDTPSSTAGGHYQHLLAANMVAAAAGATSNVATTSSSGQDNNLCASAPNLRKISLGNLPTFGFSSFRRPLYCDTDLDEDNDPPAISNCPSCYFKWLDHRKRIPCDRCVWKNNTHNRSATIGPSISSTANKSPISSTSRSKSKSKPSGIQNTKTPWKCISRYPSIKSTSNNDTVAVAQSPTDAGGSGVVGKTKKSKRSNRLRGNNSAAANIGSMEVGNNNSNINVNNSSIHSNRWRKVDQALWSVMRVLSAVALPDRELDTTQIIKDSQRSPTMSVDNTNTSFLPTTLQEPNNDDNNNNYNDSVFNLSHDEPHKNTSPPPIPCKPSHLKTSCRGRGSLMTEHKLRSNTNCPSSTITASSASSSLSSSSWWRGSSAPPKQRKSSIGFTSANSKSSNPGVVISPPIIMSASPPPPPLPHQVPPPLSSRSTNKQMSVAIDNYNHGNYFASWLPIDTNSQRTDLKLGSQNYETGNNNSSCNTRNSSSCDQQV